MFIAQQLEIRLLNILQLIQVLQVLVFILIQLRVVDHLLPFSGNLNVVAPDKLQLIRQGVIELGKRPTQLLLLFADPHSVVRYLCLQVGDLFRLLYIFQLVFLFQVVELL